MTLAGDPSVQLADPCHANLAVLRRYCLVAAERRASVISCRLAFPEAADLLRVARQLLAAVLKDTQRHLFSSLTLPVIGTEQ